MYRGWSLARALLLLRRIQWLAPFIVSTLCLLLIFIFRNDTQKLHETNDVMGNIISATTPFVKTFENLTADYNLLRDEPEYLQRLVAGVKKIFPGTQEEFIEVFEDKTFILKATKKFKYHKNIVDVHFLPLAQLARDASAISIDLEYGVNRPGRIYWELIWCDKDGRPLDFLDQHYLRIFVDNKKINNTILEIFEYIYVPLDAYSVRINMAFAAEFDITVKEIKIRQHRFANKTLSETAVHVRSSEDKNGASYDLIFESSRVSDGEHYLAARGVELALQSVTETYVMRRDHRIEQLKDGAHLILNKFEPQSLIFQTVHMGYVSLSFFGSDLLEIRRQGSMVQVFAYDYHFAERMQEVLPPYEDKEGRWINTNLGATPIIHRSNLLFVYAKNVDYFIVPLWQPAGALATLVLTEHADLVNSTHQRILLYGADDDTIRPGIGFVGNNIPFTTTVFVFGDHAHFNIESFQYQRTALATDLELTALYSRLIREGFPIEIGSHTASAGLDFIEGTQQALEALQRFNSKVWIDHGLLGNYDSLCRLGWDKTKPAFYVIPTLKRYGYQYAWAGTDKVFSQLNLIREGVPTNFFYYVPQLDDDIEDDWSLTMFGAIQTQLPKLQRKDIEHLIKQRGISIIHIYFILYSLNAHGHLTDEANAALRMLADFKAQGDLFMATLSTWGNYIKQVQKIRIFPGKNRLVIKTTSELSVPAVTFGIRSVSSKTVRRVLVDEIQSTASKHADGVLYFWTDFAAEARGKEITIEWQGAASRH